MSSFKDMVERDNRQVFQNLDEFAELRHVFYNGASYAIPAILDQTVEKDRAAYRDDHVDGLYLVEAMLYIAFDDMGIQPKKGQRITVDDHEYYVRTSACEMGQLEIGLERIAE